MANKKVARRVFICMGLLIATVYILKFYDHIRWCVLPREFRRVFYSEQPLEVSDNQVVLPTPFELIKDWRGNRFFYWQKTFCGHKLLIYSADWYSPQVISLPENTHFKIRFFGDHVYYENLGAYHGQEWCVSKAVAQKKNILYLNIKITFYPTK